MKHILIFALFLATLTLLRKLLNLSDLPDDRKTVLDKVHFYMFVITLVIFSTSFIIKVLVFEFQGMKR